MRKIVCILASALVLLSCTKDAPVWDVKNLNGNKISTFGHAGMGIFYRFPINSFESIEQCYEIGADGSEMDVQMTRDSVLVLFHDEKMQDGSHCEGYINNKNWHEISQCAHKTPTSRSTRLISASFLLSRMDRSKLITFDCKLFRTPDTDYTRFLHTYASSLIRLTDLYGMREKVFVESDDTTFLRILHTKAPDLKLFFYPPDFTTALKVADQMGLYGITIDNADITEEQVKAAHDHNRRVTVWNVRTENMNIEATKKNVDFIQSDRLRHLLKMYGNYEK